MVRKHYTRAQKRAFIARHEENTQKGMRFRDSAKDLNLPEGTLYRYLRAARKRPRSLPTRSQVTEDPKDINIVMIKGNRKEVEQIISSINTILGN